MKILATGAAGMVGSYLGENVFRTDIDTLDVTDRAQVAARLDEHAPDAVLHLAAETDVDCCELEQDHAFRVNALGTRNVALECAARGITLVYTSTAGIFSGEKHGAYHEFDEPDPANVYGETKLAGERYVRQFAPKSFIVRAGWMIGGGTRKEKKFIAKMLERAAQTGEIWAVDDKWGSPTFGRHLVDRILPLLETDEYGTYHMANEGSCTRYDVAVRVNELLGRPYEVKPVSSAAFPLPAPRARTEALDNMMLRLQGWPPMPPWEEAVDEYVSSEWRSWRSDWNEAVADS